MKTKRLVSAAVSVALMAGVATSAFAATPSNVKSRPKPTAQQAAELKQIRDQMTGVREQIIDKFVAFGWLTPEKAAQMKTHDERGQTQGHRPDQKPAGDRDPALLREKLQSATAQQKEELSALRKQLDTLRDQLMAKMASYGWTAPERGAHMKARSENPGFDGTGPQN